MSCGSNLMPVRQKTCETAIGLSDIGDIIMNSLWLRHVRGHVERVASWVLLSAYHSFCEGCETCYLTGRAIQTPVDIGQRGCWSNAGLLLIAQLIDSDAMRYRWEMTTKTPLVLLCDPTRRNISMMLPGTLEGPKRISIEMFCHETRWWRSCGRRCIDHRGRKWGED
jgi:hypothetical protein